MTDADGPVPPVFLKTGTTVPYNPLEADWYSSPTLGDLDGDGDLDLIVGNETGAMDYYKNTGTASAPVFAKQGGTANPLNGFDVGSYSAPALVDVDADGDLDVVVGEDNDGLNYFENTGSAEAPAFAERSGAANPFDGLFLPRKGTPTFGDLDGDGDLDLIVGGFIGTLRYFENTGSATAPTYVHQPEAANPLNGVDVGDYATPALGDLDGDGDLDLVIGEEFGTLNYFENTGSSSAPTFVIQGGTANPLDGLVAAYGTAPALVDLDSDGDLDAVIGERYGSVTSLENTAAHLKLVVNVAAENDVPVARNDRKSIGEDTVLNAAVPTATDVDGTIARYALDSDVAKGAPRLQR